MAPLNEGDRYIDTETINDMRYYIIERADGTIVKYPSVTSVFSVLPTSAGLLWFQRNHPDPERHKHTRAMIGSTAHYYFECKNAKYLPGHIPEMENIPFREFYESEHAEIIGNINRKLKAFTQLNHLRAKFLEVPVWSHRLKMAGRIDFAGEFNHIARALVDLKTAKRFYKVGADEYDLHALQQTAYKIGLLETYGYDVEEAFILRCNEANAPQVKQLTFDEESLLEVREIFRQRWENES